MRALAASELLELWERASALPPSLRPIDLLDACFTDEPGPLSEELTLGERNRRLMRLRRSLFGPVANGIVECTVCGTQMEMGFDLDKLIATANTATAEAVQVDWDRSVLGCRPPTTADILAVAEIDDGPGRRLALLARCVTVERSGSEREHPVDELAAHLPAEIIEKLGAALEEADPLAEVELTMSCVECGERRETRFDIATFLWTELSAWVERILGEVHVLASAYGWSEAEVLAVGPTRREYYLQAVAG